MRFSDLRGVIDPFAEGYDPHLELNRGVVQSFVAFMVEHEEELFVNAQSGGRPGQQIQGDLIQDQSNLYLDIVSHQIRVEPGDASGQNQAFHPPHS